MPSSGLKWVGFQLILNPIRDWNSVSYNFKDFFWFQLILNPIRDWNFLASSTHADHRGFQLILNPIRDWNLSFSAKADFATGSN